MSKEELFKDYKEWVDYLLSFCDCNELNSIYNNPSRIYDMKYTFIQNYGCKYSRVFMNNYKDDLLQIIKNSVKEYGC